MRERIRWILLTHTHPDHCARRDAAGEGDRRRGARGLQEAESRRCHVDRALGDGDTIDGTEFRLEVLHTPGHAPNHLCFFLDEERMLFTGDTILGGMFSVVSPSTGGDMAEYIATLERLRKIRRLARDRARARRRDRRAAAPSIDEYLEAPTRPRAPGARARAAAARRRCTTSSRTLYVDTPELLLPVAAKQVYAHLKKLRTEGKVTGRDQRSRWTAT